MAKNIKKIISIIFIFLIIMTSSCSKKEKDSPYKNAPQEIKSTKNHKWFSITKTGFNQIQLPQNASGALLKPWTEAVRISYIAQEADENPLKEVKGALTPRVYALVNRVGLLCFCDNKDTDECDVKLFTDPSVFNERTASNIVFMNGNPIFSVYKNSFFNNEEKKSYLQNEQKNFRPFLMQFEPKSTIFFPLITSDNLKVQDDAEVNDFYWDGEEWFCSIKQTTKDKTLFSYLKFKPNSSLLFMSPATQNEVSISIQESSEKEFRKMSSPEDFSRAPERLKKMLSLLPKDFSFFVECKTAGGASPRNYLFLSKQNDFSNSQKISNAKAQITDTWISCLFEDGTTYINGALYGKKILKNGKTIAFRLPKLPKGFKYTDFGITGGKMIASWEESDFYKTLRAGFIIVDLEKLLYEKST